MSDGGDALPLSKKRVAGRELSRDNPGFDDDDEQEGELGTFQQASEEVLATRRIVKVRRQQARTTSSSNPFEGLQLVTPAKSHEEDLGHPNSAGKAPMEEHEDQDGGANNVEGVVQSTEPESNEVAAEDTCEAVGGKVEEVVIPVENEETELVGGQQQGGEEHDKKSNQTENASKEEPGLENQVQTEDDKSKESNEENEKKVHEKSDDQQNCKAEVSGSYSSFQQLSSRQNAFTGLAGTGFSTSSFSFGLISSEGSSFGAVGSGLLFGLANKNPPHTSIGIGGVDNGGSLQIFGSATSEITAVGGASKQVMQEVLVETGEENEKSVFAADAILFEYQDGGWKERGKGELRVNVATSVGEKARLVMRARGNYRLILNANLYADMSLKGMEKKGVTFACINSATEGKEGFTTFAFKFKEASVVEDFRYTVDTYKGKKDGAQETPEGSV